MGKGTQATILVQPVIVDMVLYWVRLRFEKSSPR